MTSSYYAVIFTSQRNSGDSPDYEKMADRMIELAKLQIGFIGLESARDVNGFVITVSYWKSKEDIRNWKLKGQVVERIKYYAHLFADRANDGGFVHASEEISNDRIITRFVDVPAFVGHSLKCNRIVNHFIRRVGLDNVGLLLDPVQVLLKTVKKEQEEFL